MYLTLHTHINDEITPELLTSAAKLFSEHYGVWPHGSRVKMSLAKLKRELLPEDPGVKNIYGRAALNGDGDGNIIGHVFASSWSTPSHQRVLWVTQLVVHTSHRNQGIATSLLRHLHSIQRSDFFGILSSHAGAIRATLRVFGSGIEKHEMLEKRQATSIMQSSKVRYVRDAKVHENGKVAMTGFFVDHREPEEALERVKREGKTWPLGELPEGCEFLVVGRVEER